MFNPSDLEGDVDHSFFDSDRDEDRDRRGGSNSRQNAEEDGPSGSFQTLEDDRDSDCSTQDTRGARAARHSASEAASERSSRAKRPPSSSTMSSRYSSPGGSKRRGREPSARVPSRTSNRSDYTLRDGDSPGSSPLQRLRLVEPREGSAKEKRRQSATPTRASSILRPEGTLNAGAMTERYSLWGRRKFLSGVGTLQGDTTPQGVVAKHSDTDSFASGSLIQDNLILHCRGRPSRKNFTFNNNEVRRIDHENQRLLRVLSRISLAPGAIVNQFTRKNTTPHIPHSSVNRLREQKRIDKDNQALLKRLEYVKSTPTLKRSNQLSDYQRHARFQATPCEVCDAATNILPSSVAGLSSIRGSTSQIGTRATSASSNATRSKALLAARPPFCC